MKIKGILIFILFFAGCLTGRSFAQNKAGHCDRVSKLIYLFEKFHYQPLPLNDNSGAILERFFNQLDPYGFIFTKEDIIKFTAAPPDLSDKPADEVCKFIENISSLYKSRLAEADTIVQSILSKPFDLSLKDSMVISKEYDPVRAGDEKGIRDQWEKWLKYRIVYGLYMLDDDTNAITNSSSILKNIGKEPELRSKLLIKERKRLNSFLSGEGNTEDHLLKIFLNALAGSYDPHSNYYFTEDKNNFIKGVSTDEYSFGIIFDVNDNDEVIIGRLVPGGPAWKSKELFAGDKIIKIKWPNNKSQDLSYADIDEVESAIEYSDAKTVEITVRNSNGEIKKVSLKKEKIALDENKVKSYILKGEKKIGYISLPGFYTDMLEPYSGQGCANDVAKEILKLKSDSIEGLVIDIRNNGGGSMTEVLELAGIFIDEGTFLLIKDKKGPAHNLKDKNRGLVYSGPLMLMVNSNSASASEVLAGVLQDYHRAVIAGRTTFGKATAQVILPLDTSYNPNVQGNFSEKDGYIKITIEKLFRLNRKSYQKTGIIPDVIMPSLFSGIESREASYDNALNADSVIKNVLYTPLPVLPLKALSDKSYERMAKNESFKKIKQLNDSLKKNDSRYVTFYTDTASFIMQENKNNSLMDEYDKLTMAGSTDFNTVNNSMDKELYRIDPYKKEINDELLDNIQHDIYIDECYMIMTDLINLGTNK